MINQPLIPCDDRNGSVLQSKESFTYLLKAFSQIGGTVNKKTAFLIEQYADSNNLTVAQAEKGLLWALENCQYKPQWSDVLRGIKQTTTGDQNTFRKLHD